MHLTIPIKTIADLAVLLDTPESLLWHIAKKTPNFYKFKKEPKKNSSGFRDVSAPRPKLKLIQQKLHSRLFKKIIYSEHSHYGLKKKSNITNAREHCGNKFILTRDLKSFFPSVRPERVYAALIKEHSCPEQVASLLTKLVTVNYQLPQGAPTSTDIANIVTYRLQRRLAKLCAQWGLTKFTIYADDITFSGNHIPDGFKKMVKKVIEEEGFKVHAKKGGTYDKSKSQIVTGVNIAHGPSVGKVKKIWRAEHHNNKKMFQSGNISKEELEASGKKLEARMAYSASVKRIASISSAGN